MFPLLLPNRLSDADCAAVIAYAETHVEDFGKLDSGFWDGRVIQFEDISDAAIKEKLLANRSALKAELFSRIKDVEPGPLFGDTLQIVRWPAGYELHPHADRENPDGSPHQFPWREYAAVTFLNNDFTGGELYFPDHALSIPPTPGSAIIFPGDAGYMHGVAKITAGMRYTIASFLTHDATRADSTDRL